MRSTGPDRVAERALSGHPLEEQGAVYSVFYFGAEPSVRLLRELVPESFVDDDLSKCGNQHRYGVSMK